MCVYNIGSRYLGPEPRFELCTMMSNIYARARVGVCGCVCVCVCVCVRTHTNTHIPVIWNILSYQTYFGVELWIVLPGDPEFKSRLWAQVSCPDILLFFSPFYKRMPERPRQSSSTTLSMLPLLIERFDAIYLERIVQLVFPLSGLSMCQHVYGNGLMDCDTV
jgi:hypothetical protein